MKKTCVGCSCIYLCRRKREREREREGEGELANERETNRLGEPVSE